MFLQSVALLYIVLFPFTAILALSILVLFFWGFLQVRHSGLRSPAFLKFSMLASALLLSGLLCLFLFYSQLTARGGILNYNAVANYADSERVQYLKMAVDMVKEHYPLARNPRLQQLFSSMKIRSQPTVIQATTFSIRRCITFIFSWQPRQA